MTAKEVAGRLLLFLIDIPDSHTPLYTANIYMPTAGDRTNTKTALTYELDRFIAKAKHNNGTLLLSGDYNAVLHPLQRLGYAMTGKAIQQADTHLQEFTKKHELSTATHTENEHEHTWHSNDLHKSARLDHTLSWPKHAAHSTTTHNETYSITDHSYSVTTLHTSLGTRPPTPPKSYARRLDFAKRDEKAAIWQAQVTAALPPTDPTSSLLEQLTLQAAQDEALKLADVLYGKDAGRPRRLYKSAEVLLLNRELAALRNARRHTHRLLAVDLSDRTPLLPRLNEALFSMTSALTHGTHGPPDTPAIADPTHTTLTAYLTHLSTASQTRNKARIAALRKMQREHMKAATNFKIEQLFKPGTKAIKRAMRKLGHQLSMSDLCSTHPSTLELTSTTSTHQSLMQAADTFCKATLSGHTIHHLSNRIWINVTVHTDITPLIEHANQHVWPITSIHHHERGTDHAHRAPETLQANTLSAIEAELGDNGRAMCMKCEHCHKNTLCTISALTDNKRTLHTYCKTCNKTTTPYADSTYYDDHPMREAILRTGRIIPPKSETLRKAVTLRELRSFISKVKIRRAAGDDGFPPELWRDAPDCLLQVLLDTINEALRTGKMPDEWRGGIIKLLFKNKTRGPKDTNDPAALLKNWRPIVLLRIAYKIYTKILTARLTELATRYKIIEPEQEGFQAKRSTARQLERITNLFAHARNQKHTIYVSFLDMANAFNTCDHVCLFKTLEMLGIPDLDLIKDLLEGSHFTSSNCVGTTAQVPLTRGVKQGSTEAPIIFLIFINTLLRHLKDAGVGIKHETGTSCCGGFADDTIVFNSSPDPDEAERQHMELLRRLEEFCSWSNLQLNVQKCAICAHDFDRNADRDTTNFSLNGSSIPKLLASEPYKYLGVHICVDGNCKKEKAYILDKTRTAVEYLHNTCYTRRQIDSLIDMCVIPLFLYSAALVPWTPCELRKIEALWLRARKHAWKVSYTLANAPFQLEEGDGGLAHKTIEWQLIKAQQRHFAQCLQHDDEVRSITLQHHRRCMQQLGAHDAIQAQTELAMGCHYTALRSSSLLRLLKTTQEVGCGLVTPFFDTPAADTRLLDTIQEQRIHAALHPPAPASNTTLPHLTAEWALHQRTQTHSKAVKALIKAGCTTTTSLLSCDHTTLRLHCDLPTKLKRAIPKSTYNAYRTHLLQNTAWQHTHTPTTCPHPSAITSHFHPDTTPSTDPPPGPPPPPLPTPPPPELPPPATPPRPPNPLLPRTGSPPHQQPPTANKTPPPGFFYDPTTTYPPPHSP